MVDIEEKYITIDIQNIPSISNSLAISFKTNQTNHCIKRVFVKQLVIRGGLCHAIVNKAHYILFCYFRNCTFLVNVRMIFNA